MNKTYKLYLLSIIISLNLLISPAIYSMEEDGDLEYLKKTYKDFTTKYEGKAKEFVDENVKKIIENGVVVNLGYGFKEETNLTRLNNTITELRGKNIHSNVAFIVYLEDLVGILKGLLESLNISCEKEINKLTELHKDKIDKDFWINNPIKKYRNECKKVDDTNKFYTNLLQLYLLEPANHCIFQYVTVTPDDANYASAVNNAAAIGSALAGISTLDPNINKSLDLLRKQ